jgi:hypothetical protein
MSPVPKSKPIYVMVSRKLINTWLIVTIFLSIGVAASFQYTNWVNRRNNSQWCGLVSIFDDNYKRLPPPSDTGKAIAPEITRLRTKFNCK